MTTPTAEDIPAAWVKAAEGGYSMHGAGLIRNILAAAAPHIAAAERERWRATLADHYLMGVNCDPDTHRDNPMCGCSRIHLGWHASIGAAHQAWIDHVTEALP